MRLANNSGLAKEDIIFHLFRMESIEDEVLNLFEKTGALLKGHFVLRSGLHSGHFFQCAQVCQNMAAVTRMAELTLAKLLGFDFEKNLKIN